LKKVLRKVGKSLREEGNVLIFQPAIENPIVEVEIGGEVVFREVTNELNFRFYLRATEEAIYQTVEEGIFDVVSEATIPEGNSYHCNEYGSVKEWEEDRLTYCEDIEVFTAMSEKIQALVRSQNHKVLEYWKEYKVLLRKRI
jgi:hypothetical protein